MCFGCSKESSHQDGSFEYPQHMFQFRNKKDNFQLLFARGLTPSDKISGYAHGDEPYVQRQHKASDVMERNKQTLKSLLGHVVTTKHRAN